MSTAATQRRLNGVALRVIREALGVSLGDLARRADVSRPYVSLMESGARQPAPPVLRRLATALAIPLEAISYPGGSTEAQA